MADLLTFARDRRSDLTRQIDELEEFIRMARHLAETVRHPVAGNGSGTGTMARSEPRPIEAQPAVEDEAEEAIAVEAVSDSDAIGESATDEHKTTRALLENAPWKGVTPKMRAASTGDPFGPPRFNLLRRGAPVAG